jgi:uncharacterized repeat protein (TIGR01451 family)
MIAARRMVKKLLLKGLGCLILGLALPWHGAQAQCFLYCVPCPLPCCEPLPCLPAPVQGLPAPRPFPLQEPQASDDPPTPIVAIRVRVPVSSAAGKELEYRILVENTSPAAAHHVMVRDPLPANARFVRADPEPSTHAPELLWHLGSLEAGAKREIVLILAPTGGDEIKNCARVQFEHGECVSTRIARPALRLDKQGPAQAVLYDSLNYRITLTNTGEAELTNLLLTDTLHAGLEHATHKDRLSWLIGTLAPGQSQTVEYQVIAKMSGRLCNKAVATAAGNFRQEQESCVTVGEAKLGMTMTGPKKSYVNTAATYQIILANTGTLPVQNIVVTNPVPAGLTFQSASDGGRLSGTQVQWNLGTLAPGMEQKLDVVFVAQSIGRICNQATTAGERGLSRQAEFCTDFIGMPALSLLVEDTEDPVEVGGTTSYLINVRNQGTSPVTSVRIVAIAPAQEQVTDATGAAKHRVESQKVTFEPVTLRAGETAQYRVNVKALRAGDVRFKVQLTADQLIAGPVEQQESTMIYSALPSARQKIKKKT